MITREELITLISSDETARVEKTESITNNDKFCEAICSFANDMTNTRQNGYLLIGVKDNVTLSGLKITDEFQLKISAIRSDGNILPIPTMNVMPFHFDEGDVLVVEVTPSSAPPVRYKGRTCIRIGARKGYATIEEEQILSERVSAYNPPFDTMPCREASINDIDIELFEKEYLPKAMAEGDGVDDNRTIKEKMAALRLYNIKYDCPTFASIILFGKNPKYFLPGDYIQFLCFEGVDNAAEISNEHEFKECLAKMLPKLDTFIEISIAKKRPVPISALRERIAYDYPLWAIRELMMNAVMHRNYQTNTPTKLYQYKDRLEITNPGGLFGNANADNFPTVNDYRNPVIAEAMKIFGYVNKYNRGIARVNKELEENGNGKADFKVDKITVFEAVVKDATVVENEGLSNQGSNQASSQDKIINDSNLAAIDNQACNQACNQADDNDSKALALLEIAARVWGNRLNEKEITIERTKDYFPKWHEDLENESKQILEFAFVPRSKNEIFNTLGMSKQTKNSKKYLKPLIKLGLLDTTVKDKTTSPNQRYYTTTLGNEFIKYLEDIK